MAEIGEIPLLKGLYTFIRHPKETRALIRELAPQIYKRSFEREIAEAKVMRSIEGRLTEKLSPREVFMILTTSMDKLVVNSIWRGGFDDYLRKNPGMVKEAAEYATRAIRRTQPFFSIKDLPEYWRSGEFMKALTIFTNQLNQYWNYFRFDVFGKYKSGRISFFELVRKVIEGFIIPALIIGAITRSRPAQDAKELAADLTGMALATIPIAGNWLVAGQKGFWGKSGLITTELMGKMQQLSFRLNKQEWGKAALTIPELAGYVLGIPVAQPKRTIMGLLDLATGKTDDWMRLIWSEYARKRAEKERKPRGDKFWEFK